MCLIVNMYHDHLYYELSTFVAFLLPNRADFNVAMQTDAKHCAASKCDVIYGML